MSELPEGYRIASFNRQKLLNLWEMVSKYPTTFADGSKNPEDFIRRLLAKNTIVIETEGGLILIEDIEVGVAAEFHATFWDHKLSPRKEELKDILLWVFLTFNLERLETTVASYARAVKRFLKEKLGFVYEGTLRNAFKNQDEFYNLEIYSILRNEVL